MSLYKLGFVLAFLVSSTAEEMENTMSDEIVLMQGPVHVAKRDAAIAKIEANQSSSVNQHHDLLSERGSQGSTALRQELQEPITSKANASSQASLSELVFNEIEFELHRTDLPTKSKVALALLEGFALPALFGVDRCYMGQCCIGTIKGITLGGLGIWAFIDYFVILVNMLGKKESINAFGFNAAFWPGDLQAAFVISIVFLVLKVFSACCRPMFAHKR
mmetsp:Transcript_126286/g.229256  ORF Transcript_126286/g.229256 Transcript_126286/m.229256 type:complete len:219 (-) Transcript_126286:229-885(-)